MATLWLALTWPGTASASISLVQTTPQFRATSSVSATSAAFASPPAVGNRIIVIAWANNGSSTPTLSVTDSRGNTYTSRAQGSRSSGGQGTSNAAVLDAVVASTGAGFTVTVTAAAGSSKIEAVAMEYTGVGAVDRAQSANGGGSPVTVSTGAATTVNNTLVVSTLALMRNSGNFTEISPAAAYTPRAVQLDRGTNAAGGGADRIAWSPGVQSNTWTVAPTSGSWAWAGAIVAYAPATPSACGPLGAAANRPVHASEGLTWQTPTTVSNGSSSFTVSGSGLAIDQNSGAVVLPSPAPVLPALSPATFPANASTTNANGPTINPGSYATVTASGNTSFASGIHHIKTLNIAPGTTLSFGSGVYHIDTMTFDGEANVVVPTGPVQINIGTRLTVDRNSDFNKAGNPAWLRIVLYPGATATTLGAWNFTGVLFAPDAGSSFSTLGAPVITGALIGSNITLGSGASITYTPATQTAIAAVSSCSDSIQIVNHYQLSLPASGLSCLASTATVTACADNSSPCTNPATNVSGQTATLSASAGALGATTLTFNAGGTASTSFSWPAATDGASATVTLSDESQAASNPRRCCVGGSACSAASSCSITFNTAGFIVAALAGGAETAITPAVAGTASSTYQLRAVRTSTSTQACEAAVTGTQTVNWGYECLNPGTCSAGERMRVTGNAPVFVPGNASGGSANRVGVAMNFDANGNAPFLFNLFDVGQVRLHATLPAGGALLAPLAGSSNAFVVRPAGFVLSNIRCSSYAAGACATAAIASPGNNPGAASAAGPAFMPAGAALSVTVTAVDSNGNATPNYGRETPPEGVLLTPTLLQPAGGAPGTVGNAGGFGAFSNGTATGSSFSYSEVGIVTLMPSVADGNYLGAGNVSGNLTGAGSGPVGRFVPASLALSSGTVQHRSALACSPASAFSYLGENFRLTATLTAVNTAGTPTLNYTGAFARFDAGQAGAWQLAGVADGISFSTANGRLSLGSATGTWNQGVLAGATLTASAGRAAAPDGPHLALFGVAPVDADGVTASAFDLAASPPFSSADRVRVATMPLRFGRLRLVSAMGPAGRTLALPLTAEHWDGSAWAVNTLDSCTPVPTAAVNFGQLSGTLTSADIALAAPVTLTAGRGQLRLAAPGGERRGSLAVALSLGADATDASCLQPWTPASGNAATAGAGLAHLRGAWCGGSHDKDPAARATFGRASGNQTLVFRRENF